MEFFTFITVAKFPAYNFFLTFINGFKLIFYKCVLESLYSSYNCIINVKKCKIYQEDSPEFLKLELRITFSYNKNK